MNKDKIKLKIFLISIVLSLPFWWGMNVLGKNLEDFLFQQEMVKNSQILTADINQKILENKIERLKFERLQTENLKDLEIEARAVIVVEIDSKSNEKILFEKNSEEPLPIASLTKLMTALVIFDLDETYSPSQTITITQEALSQEGQSKYGDLRVGEKLSVETLLHIMLIESSNDAAFALSELIGQEGFVGLMNFYANKLGFETTKFVNSTGLEPDNPREPKNLSTAKDLAELAKYILESYPKIFEITSKQYYEVLKPDGSVHHFIPQNINELLGEVPEIIGGKTGWSPESGGCLLLVLKGLQKDSYYIAVILGSNDRFVEMRKIIEAIFY